MRILWVKSDALWPLNTGGCLRSFHILAGLSRRHRVTVATIRDPGDDPASLAAALPHCEHVIQLPHVPPRPGSARFIADLLRAELSPWPVHFWRWRIPALRREVRRILAAGGADLCVVDFLKAAPNVPPAGRVPTLLFAHNVEAMIWKRLRAVHARPWVRAAYELEWRKVRAWEARMCRRASLTVAVSEADRQALSALAPGARVRAIPTGVDLEYFTSNGVPEAPAHLVFTGSMDSQANEDAILYFMRAVLPAIRREIPQVAFTAVGRSPTARLREAAARAGVRVTGTVPDVRPYVAEAAVYVVPLRAGGGTRLKLFEALAMGKAVVSTTIGAEGLPLEPGRHFLQADDPADFARATVSLLRDPARRKALGMTGRQLVEQHFGWPRVAGEFAALCEEAVGHHAR